MLGNYTRSYTVRIAGAATVMAAVVACGGGQSPTASSPVEPGGTGAADPADNTALLAAADTVRGTVPDSTVISVESERNNTQWEVQVVTPDGIEHEAEVSADGATVLGSPVTKAKEAKNVAKHRSRLEAAKLDHRAAVDAITKAVDGRITELNLDDHDGTTVWEADVVDPADTRHEVRVDAATGSVVTRN